MTINHIPVDESNHIEQLRDLARQGKTVAEIVSYVRSGISPDSGFTLIVLRQFMAAFSLTLREARTLEGAPCMGNEAISDEELNSILRPMILERLLTP